MTSEKQGGNCDRLQIQIETCNQTVRASLPFHSGPKRLRLLALYFTPAADTSENPTIGVGKDEDALLLSAPRIGARFHFLLSLSLTRCDVLLKLEDLK